MAEKVLVIDDEEDIRAGLELTLGREGYEVVTAGSGAEGIRKAGECAPDVILLDLRMPDMDGFAVCAALRRRGVKAPIIMLTGRAAEADKVKGLDTGADDYVTKPFGTKELVARIRAVRRRAAGRKEKIREFSFAGIRIDFDKQTVTRGRRTVPLSTCESELLRLLIAMRGETVTRERVLTEVWGYQFAPDTRTIDNHIVRLRQKIEDDPHHPKHILTVHGMGYKFVE